MDIHLYNIIDDDNVLNKTLSGKEVISNIKLKNPIDINKPTLSLSSRLYLNFNYAYIPEFNKYYFIDSLGVQNNDIFILNLSVDLLMTYKTEILNSDVYLDVKNKVDIFSDVELEIQENNIVVMRGGIYGGI